MYEGIEVFAMSATVGNPEELASWMDADCTVSPEGRQIEIEERAIDVAGREKKEAIVDVLRREEDKAPFLVFNYAKPWTESRAKRWHRREYSRLTPTVTIGARCVRKSTVR